MTRQAVGLLVAGLVLCVVALADEWKTCPSCNGKRQIRCASCKGAYGRVMQTVPCKGKRGVGCDGVGHRDCFKCKGEGTLKCRKCKGEGTYTVKVRWDNRSSGTWGYRSEIKQCPTCNKKGLSAGRADCPKCKPLWACSACNRGFYVAKKPEYCPCTPPERYTTSGKSTIVELAGQIKCPRCKGTGERQERTRCEYCTKGYNICTECDGHGRVKVAKAKP